METRGQISYEESTESPAVYMMDSTSQGTRAANGNGPRPKLLDLNGCLKRLIRLLSPTEKLRLRAALGERELPVMGDPGEIAAMFFALVECAGRLAPRGSITLLSTLLPFDVPFVAESTGNGCVLFSFHAAVREGKRISNLASLGCGAGANPLVSIRNIVEKRHGCFRIGARASEIVFNIYLPVATASRLANNAAGLALAKERL